MKKRCQDDLLDMAWPMCHDIAMGRSPRITRAGVCYHVLNRRVMRLPLFRKDDDYLAFERVLAESLERPTAPNLLSWCLMPKAPLKPKTTYDVEAHFGGGSVAWSFTTGTR